MKTIIAGSRSITDPRVVSEAVRCARGAGIVPHQVIEGGARGVDTLAFDYAFDHGLGWSVYQADWKKHGRAAGPIRNRRMAEHADALIAVWDGESRGTKNMIEEATRRGLKVFVFRVQPAATSSALETGEENR